MKKTYLTALTSLLVTALLTTSALAWQSTRIGERNFQRAWSAYAYKRPEAAKQYFTAAATSFAEGLAQTPPARSTMFASNLAKAGMSFYYAGRYQESIDTMGKAAKKDDRLWEAFLYSGLSYARLGNKAKTLEQFQTFLKASPAQPLLSSEVSNQMNELEMENGSLADAVAAIEKAALAQTLRNINFGQDSNTPIERCSGRYWWRYNKAPCEKNRVDYR